MEIRGAPCRQQAIAQFRRGDEEAEAQGREDRLAEAPHVDHAAVGVEAVETRNGPLAVAELAVVVVFDDPRPRAGGPLEQRQSPRQRHRHSKRELVRGCDEDETRAIGTAGAGLDVQSFLVDAHRHNARACAHQRAPRSREPRVLHPCRIALIEQERRDELQTALGAGDDDDLVGGAGGPPGRANVVGDRFAERAETGGVTVVELRRAGRAESPVGELRPQPQGKQIESGRADAKGARRSAETTGGRWHPRQRQTALRQGRLSRRRPDASDASGREIVRKFIGDERA